ncbi:unnamed protein product [Lactuca virosa]|uniref:Uncharacterized protein n=1 Tax=Lactuca virosa TaxID=75947 RepID=A0AAU9MUI1_9ASTR|nr:unnamed protein product [Lactuca virosa]
MICKKLRPSNYFFQEGFVPIMTIADSGALMDNESLCLPCTREEERRIVKELTDEAELCLKEGNLYYVVSNRNGRNNELKT